MQLAVRARLALLALCLVSASLVACGQSEGPERVTVFAAASLAEVMHELAIAFEAQHPDIDIAVHTAGTPRLLLQIREGASIDVFAPADWISMSAALQSLQLDADTVQPQVLARNQLAVAVERGNPLHIDTIQDLQRPELRAAVAGPEVPAGRYARNALVRAGLFPKPISDEPSVRAALQKVALGEADLALVYASDLDPELQQVDGWILPDHLQPEIELPIAVTSNRAAAQAFVAFALSLEGQATLTVFGFAAASE